MLFFNPLFALERPKRMHARTPRELRFGVYVQLVDALDETARGAGGYGSTGLSKEEKKRNNKSEIINEKEFENKKQNCSSEAS